MLFQQAIKAVNYLVNDPLEKDKEKGLFRPSSTFLLVKILSKPTYSFGVFFKEVQI
jgi:hypothetical protein